MNRTRLLPLLVLLGCAAGTATGPGQKAAPPSHAYAQPLEVVLSQTKAMLVEQGWQVQRSGNTLSTNWSAVGKPKPRTDAAPIAPIATSAEKPGDVIGYRVYGEQIDSGYCSIQIVRVVATSSDLYFGEKKGGHQVAHAGPNDAATHHGSSYTFENSDVFLNEEFQSQAPDESTIRTDAPFGMVVSQHDRDSALELALQTRLEPPAPVAIPLPSEGLALTASSPTGQNSTSGHVIDSVPPMRDARPAVAELPITSLTGIWDGTFTFSGGITGAYSGEVTVVIDGDSAQIDDFCPEGGGTLSATGSATFAAWQGNLACPPIAVKGCSSTVFNFTNLTATLNGKTLTLAAVGILNKLASCGSSYGDLTVTFVAHQADYVHLSVSRTRQRTACVWPSDWEDLGTVGSMAMPEPPMDDTAYLGIIRAKGDRRSEIQQLLRHCRHVVLLHGQPVVMKVAGAARGPK